MDAKLVKALFTLGQASVETGKSQALSTEQIVKGIASLHLAHSLCDKSDDIALKIKVAFRRSAKIKFLKEHRLLTRSYEEIQKDVKSKLSTLKKLQIAKKVPKNERLETKNLQIGIKSISDNEFVTDLKKLFVPDHLLCIISGDLMSEPVTIESGRTFEKASILQYFEVQRILAKKQIENADSDLEEERDLTEADFLICPVSLQKVDTTVMISNESNKVATELFLDEHPWAYEMFDPREDFMNIKVFD